MPTKKAIVTAAVLAALATLALRAYAAYAAEFDDIRLEALTDQARYAYGDTVVVGIKAHIPPGYHLYSNPLGPGIGKPLNLFVNRQNADRRVLARVEWFEARKSFPARYNPPIGSWVWAYESEAYFFIRGVLVRDTSAAADTAAAVAGATGAPAAKKNAPATAKGKPFINFGKGKTVAAKADTLPPIPGALSYEVIVEALMCRTACIPVVKSASFELPVPADGETVRGEAGAFPATSTWRQRYEKSEQVAFKVGAPVSAAAAGSAADTASGVASGLSGGPGALNIDLSGLPGLTDTAPPAQPEPQDNPQNEYDYTPLEEKREYTLVTAILFALLAGFALNLTPCIFPMLSVRVLSFAESAGESRRSAVLRSAVFSLGILAVFLLLAGLAAFAGFSWGQQFQNPGMMAGIIAIVFLFALGMFGFYTLPVPAALGGVGQKSAGSAFAGDFLKGAAATVMATPCGGPFLGALLAWALLQKPLTIFIIFATMGVGMAFPYVLLASSKRLMGLLPKPGRWIDDLKHFMGFLLLAFAVNMMRSLDPRLVTTAVGVCLSILIAASVNKRFSQFGMPTARRAVVLLIALTLLAAGIAVSVTYLRIDTQIFNDDSAESTPSYWVEFSPQALLTANNEKCNAIVNFTASWCTNCKLNKATALNTEAAKKLYHEKNVLLLTADITNDNPEAQELLRRLGSRSVPFLAIFPGDAPKSPIIMRDIISREKFLAELRNLP
jgi:thiol:disulfide interchange protein